MNKKIALFVSLLFCVLMGSAFFGITAYQNSKVVQEVTKNFAAEIKQEVYKTTSFVRDDLLQGHIIIARSRLSQIVSNSRIKSFEILQENKENLWQDFDKSKKGESIKVPVYFSKGGEIWGYVEYRVSFDEIALLEKRLNQTLIWQSISLLVFLIFSIILLLLAISRFSKFISLQIEKALGDSFPSNQNTLFEVLWSPLVNSIKETGESVLKIRKNIDDLKRNEKVFELSRKVAHDIRSPVGALGVVVSKSANLSEKEKELLTKIKNRIEEVAEQLLLDSKAQFVEIVETEKLKSKILDVIEEKKLVYPKIHFSPDEMTSNSVVCNLIGIQNIISNLINNSIQALESQSQIDIEIKESMDSVYIKVQDKGAGIDSKYIEKVLRGEFSSKNSGNSLGLSTSKTLVESWGGHFSIQSAPGEGTVVTIVLPLVQKLN